MENGHDNGAQKTTASCNRGIRVELPLDQAVEAMSPAHDSPLAESSSSSSSSSLSSLSSSEGLYKTPDDGAFNSIEWTLADSGKEEEDDDESMDPFIAEWAKLDEGETMAACISEKVDDAAAILKGIEPYLQLAWQAKKGKFSKKVVVSSRVVTKPCHFFGRLGKMDSVVHVCLLKEKNSVAFVFRGTELFHLDCPLCDIVTDIAQKQGSIEFYDPSCEAGPVYQAPSSIKAHCGFQLALKQVTQTSVRSDNIRLVLEDMGMASCDVSKIWCVGHSLGGAVATLCAKWCREVAFPNAEINCVTMGSPKVGNSEFAWDFDTRVVNHSFRVVNKRDIVPCLPHPLTYPKLSSPYTHVSGAIYLHKDPKTGDLRATMGGRRPTHLNFYVSHHRRKAYLRSIHQFLQKFQ